MIHNIARQWSDKWDPKDFAQNYIPNKNFFEQYKELQKKVPRLALMMLNSTRSEYTNGASDNKDCYLIFAAEYNEDCMYSRLIQRSKDTVDSAFVYDSELCYECVDVNKCYHSMYSEQCQTSSDLLFCYNMRDCQNCILSTNGRHLSYAILNKKCTKEEFEQKKKEILSSYENIEKAKREFAELKKNTVVKYASTVKCHNVTGDYISNCHEGVRVFDASDTKNCSYVADTVDSMDSQDCNNYYYKNQFCYNMMGILQSNKCKSDAYVFYCNEVEYSENCHNLNNGIGCNGIRKGQYIILNKEYSKEEYEKIKSEIVEQMRRDGAYGEFLPPDLSPFGWNESLGADYYQMNETKAKERGFNWQAESSGIFGKETIKEDAMPASIEEVTDKILDEVLVCIDCKKNFRITRDELDFYKRLGLPLPRKDFECRHQDRMKKRNPRALWHRACMCDKSNHPNHLDIRCPNTFETSYSPDRKEIIYCETCYQQEVY
ncbi:MAG: hypothetical protein WD991_01360 [Candidatus Paceibacterota bacterium]